MKSDNHHYGATEVTYQRASVLRKPQTKAEKLLWPAVRNRNLEGYKIRRQHAAGPFIVDFYCHEARLVIEIDGENHLIDTVRKYDQWREQQLRSVGLDIIRFTNHQVYTDIDGVLKAIVVRIKSRLEAGVGK